jgi:hypothetical protein
LIAAMAAVAGGCDNVQYDLVQPAALTQRVGAKTVTVRRAPLEYRLTRDEDHLVVQIYNRSAQPMTLLGGASNIVDPDGQSHPLSSRVIASQSFIKLILPPVRPIRASEPLGFSRGFFGPEFPYNGDPYWDGPPYAPDPFFDTPPSSPAFDDQEGSYWRWGHGDVRLILVYMNGIAMPAGSQPSAPATQPDTAPIETPPGSFTHEFLFRQVKP